MNGNFEAIHGKSFGQWNAGLRFHWQIHIINPATRVAIKMAVLVHVGTKSRRAPVELHLADQAAFDKCIQAIIDRGMGNLRHRAFGADKNFLRSRMIALLEQDIIDLLALRRGPQAACGQARAQVAAGLLFDGVHNSVP